MKTKIYTATIVVEDISGKTTIDDNIYTASFASAAERDKWTDDTYAEITREFDAENEGLDWACYTHNTEQEIDIPVFVTINVDYRHNDENCGLATSAFHTKEEAVKCLKDSIDEEIEVGSIREDEIDWHVSGNKMPENPIIADTNRFGWTIEEY